MATQLMNRNCFLWSILLVMIDRVLALSFNQPKFCPILAWQTNGTTFANSSTLGYHPLGLFIDKNNTIYTTDYNNNRTLIWSEGSDTPTTIIYHNLSQPVGIFVTDNGDVYIDNGLVNGRVDKWSINFTTVTPVMDVKGSCYGLFVDRNNTLYCSIHTRNQVMKISLTDSPNMTVIAAGNGTQGLAPNMLNYPTGIYVDTNFDLYVADLGNNRIQLFRSGQANATTLAGNGAPGTVDLQNPTGVTIDGNGHLFIVNRGAYSILRSGPHGYHCVVGCSGTTGPGADQLSYPYQLAFDSDGNMFVMDQANSRLQKFILTTNSCISYNQPKLCPNATWNVNATTIANASIISGSPHGLFIDYHDTVYFAAQSQTRILTWFSGSTSPFQSSSINLSIYTTLFVSVYGNIYFESNSEVGRIDRWLFNTIGSTVFVTKFNESCYGLFLDISNTLYCSMRSGHRVVSTSLSNNTNTSTTVVGTGISGSTSYQLDNPWGIFVDMNSDLYVADASNNRIQLFPRGQSNATTMAGNGTPNGLTLKYPTDVILDADGYMFIADNQQNRIIRADRSDYYCVASCSGTSGSAPNQLNKVYSLRFDSQANLYVADEANSRIQKFLLATNSCADTSIVATSTSKLHITSRFQQTTPPETTSEKITSMKDSTATTTSMEETTTIQVDAKVFMPPVCSDPFRIGTTCNISSAPCELTQPCRNNGTCNNDNTTVLGYICSCPSGFHGTQCQFDHRLCKPNTCWNNGVCEERLNSTFVCRCEEGWYGVHCGSKINYCDNITCHKNGVCRPLLRGYQCECLGNSFSGRHCEITATYIQVYQVVSRSVGYVAIIAMISVVMFVVVMDILKYCFGIDPVDDERERIQRKKPAKRRKPVIQRFVYVNAPTPSEQPISIVNETPV